jgi:hypothetical protein
MRLVRIVAPHFVAGFETDGTVRRAAPIIGYMSAEAAYAHHALCNRRASYRVGPKDTRVSDPERLVLPLRRLLRHKEVQ